MMPNTDAQTAVFKPLINQSLPDAVKNRVKSVDPNVNGENSLCCIELSHPERGVEYAHCIPRSFGHNVEESSKVTSSLCPLFKTALTFISIKAGLSGMVLEYASRFAESRLSL
jgi:hypothetical protein